jgi:ElaB/YqjD/DUF883 family membrane-anchored ribosome-binding protein
LSSKDDSKEIRKDIKEAADMVRREMRSLGKDLLTGTKAMKNSTQKFIEDTAPKVTAILDEAVTRASEAFSKTMEVVDKQTRGTQAELLRSYKNFLSRQVELIDRRLKKISK